jgi:hypothetical protein
VQLYIFEGIEGHFSGVKVQGHIRVREGLI